MPAPHIDISSAARSALAASAGLLAWSALLGIGAATAAWAGTPGLASAAGTLLAALASAPLALSDMRHRGGLTPRSRIVRALPRPFANRSRPAALLALAAISGAALQVALALLPAPLADAAPPVALPPSAASALSASLFAPMGEEVCFRLVLLRSLRGASRALGLGGRAAAALALFAQAAAFAYMHPAASFARTLVLGIVCGVAADRHGVAAPIALHMGFNAAALALMAL